MYVPSRSAKKRNCEANYRIVLPSSHLQTVFDQDEGLETKTEINHKDAALNREPIVTHLTWCALK